MNAEQARVVVDEYRAHLINECPAEGPMDRTPTEQEQRNHLSHMLDMMEEMLDDIEDIDNNFDHLSDSAWSDLRATQGLWGKFFRWLGFMQGVMWSQGDFTLDDMRGHNTSCSRSS